MTRPSGSRHPTQCLYDSYIMPSILKHYQDNSGNLPMCSSILSLITTPAPLNSDWYGPNCYCVDLKRAMNVGIVEICIHMLQQSLNYLQRNILFDNAQSFDLEERENKINIRIHKWKKSGKISYLWMESAPISNAKDKEAKM
eukprot:360927_1